MSQKRSFAEIQATFDQQVEHHWTIPSCIVRQDNTKRARQAPGAMAYSEGPCDSYFIEPQDGRRQSYRDALRERERHVKQQTQLAIAEELSQLVSNEYCADVLAHMETMEVEQLTIPDPVTYANALQR